MLGDTTCAQQVLMQNWKKTDQGFKIGSPPKVMRSTCQQVPGWLIDSIYRGVGTLNAYLWELLNPHN